MKTDTEDLACRFMLRAVCVWDDHPDVKIKAVQNVLDELGFDAEATCWPAFGGIWPKPCTGKDAVVATKWLVNLTENLVRGEFNSEVRQVKAAIDAGR